MKTWQKIGLLTLFVLILFGLRIYFIWRERHAAIVQPHPTVAERPLTQDEVVQRRKMYIDSLKRAQALTGKTMWIQSGYSRAYSPYATHRLNFKNRVGFLPGAHPLQIRDIITEKAP